MNDPKRFLTTLVLSLALGALGFGAMKYFGIGAFTEASSDNANTAQNTADNASAVSESDRSAKLTATATITEQTALSEKARASRQAAQQFAHIETKEFKATFSDLSSAMTSFELKGERYLDLENDEEETARHPKDLVTTDREEYAPFRVNIGGLHMPADARWELQQVDATTIRFEWRGSDMKVVRTWHAGTAPYQLWSTVYVENEGRAARSLTLNVISSNYVSRDQESGGFLGRPSPHVGEGLCFANNDLARLDREKLLQGEGRQGNVDFVGLGNAYFATLIAADKESPADYCGMQSFDRGGTSEEPHGSLFEVRLKHPAVDVPAGGSHMWRSAIYAGPKSTKAMQAFGHSADEAINLGWFSFIARGLNVALRAIHAVVGNWGLAIILLTFCVKLLLYPLTAKSFKSTARMRLLKPEMDKLNERYADEPEKKGAAVMELYRKHGVNPLSGCLPQVVQIPIWFALYQSLSTNIELYHVPFTLWWTDLSSPDKFYVLPLALGALMFVQQKLTPMAIDAKQAKIMLYLMPAMITFFMLFLPAGLCLYMVTNSILSISQQKYIHSKLNKLNAGAEASNEETPIESIDSGNAPFSSPRPSRPRKRKKKRHGKT